MQVISKKLYQPGAYLIVVYMQLNALIIEEGAELKAPDGKALFMTVFGVGKPILPGNYKGDIRISVADEFTLQPGGLCRTGLPKIYQTAIYIEDNQYDRQRSVPAVVQGGTVTGTEINDITIRSTLDGFTGMVIRGDSQVEINRARIYLDGDHGNDYVGYGSGIHCAGTSRVVINDSDIRTLGLIRNTLHAGEESKVVLNRCKLYGYSPDSAAMNPTWQMGLRGTSRAAMLVDMADVEFNSCFISSNGWGTVSIDGGFHNVIRFTDCTLELLGARSRGYASFAIGEALITYDHTKVDVQGYGMLVGASGIIPGVVESVGVITNQSEIISNANGVYIFFTRASKVTVDKGSSIHSKDAAFVAMSCQALIDLDEAQIAAENGVILQLMDNTYTGLGAHPYIPHIGMKDTYIPGRELSKADPQQDIIMNLSNMETTGDFLNSTTNLCAAHPQDENSVEMYKYNEMDWEFDPLEFDPETSFPIDNFRWLRVSGDFQPSVDPGMLGPRNLEVNMNHAKVTGVISAATAAYRDGLDIVDVRNVEELLDIVQTPAEAVNNGVIVNMDSTSVWTLTGTAYLTALKIEDGALLQGVDGKKVHMTVDGREVSIASGNYSGKIMLYID